MLNTKRVFKKWLIVFILCLVTFNGMAENRFAYAQNQPSSLLTIRGTSTSQPSFEMLDGKQEVLIYPTAFGLYLIEEGKIIRHFLSGELIAHVAVVNDQDADGMKDLVIAVQDELAPNVRCLSSRTGETLWWFSPENQMFKEGFGWFDFQPQVTGFLLSSAEEDFVTVAAGYSLYHLRAKNGSMIWEHREPSPIVSFTNVSLSQGNQVEMMAITNDSGEIAGVDAQNGEEIWRDAQQISSVIYTGSELWSIEKNAAIHAYNPKNGDLLWARSPDRSKQPEDYEIQAMADVNEDDTLDVVMTSNTAQKIICINGQNGDQEWEFELSGAAEKINVLVTEAYGKKALLTVGYDVSKVQRYVLLDIINGQEIREGILAVEYDQQDMSSYHGMAADHSGRILFAGDRSAVRLFDRELTTGIWSLPRSYPSGFLNPEDGSGDSYLLYSAAGKNHGLENIVHIQKRSESGETLWEYTVISQRAAYRGLDKLRVCNDFNNDGIDDLLGASFYEGYDQTGKQGHVLAINGKTGNELWLADLMINQEVKDLLILEDVNGDGPPEILASTGAHFFVLDGSSGKILKTWTHDYLKAKNYFEPTKGLTHDVKLLPAGDVNKDGFLDIFVVDQDEVRIGLTNKVDGVDYYYKELFRISQGQLDLEKADTFDDLNKDGIAELFLVRKTDDQNDEIIIVSGDDGKPMVSVHNKNAAVKGSGVDFNQNGQDDILVYQENIQGKKEISVLDSSKGELLWSYSKFDAAAVRPSDIEWPVCVAEDLNGDAIPELAIVKNAVSGTGMQLEFFDVAGGWDEPYKTSELQPSAAGPFNIRWAPGLLIEPVQNQNSRYLAIAGRLGGKDEGIKLLIYDYTSDRPAAVYPIEAKAMKLKNSELIIEDYDGKVSFFKFNPDLSNITVTNRNGISSSLKMEWNHELPFLKTRIYVDQILALETAEDTAELDLTAGKHIVGIAQYSLEGEHFYQYYVVDVVKSDVIRMVVYVCAALAVLLAFILPFILKRRMGAGVNNV